MEAKHVLFFSQRSSVLNVVRHHSHFFWVLRGIKGSIYSFCHRASTRHEVNKQFLVGDDAWMDPVHGWGQATKGLLYHCAICWRPKATIQVGGRVPRWARTDGQSMRTRCSIPGKVSWLHASHSIPCQLTHRAALAADSQGLFRCISVWGTDVMVTK